MKSMKYYINSEPQNYKNVSMNYRTILAPMIEKFVSSHNKYTSIVILATGSSSNAAYGAVPYMTQRLNIPIYVVEPSIAANYHSKFRDDIFYIAISQGGHSASTIKIVKELVEQNIDVYVITSQKNSPIAKSAAEIVLMGMEIEEMPYVTLGYSITILLLFLFAMESSYECNVVTKDTYVKDKKQIDLIINNFPSIIKCSEAWVDNYLKNNNCFSRIYFIGYGATYGIAREGETKITETVHVTAQGKELEEYMHGPYIGLHNSDRFIFIEPQGKLETRSQKLQQFLKLHSEYVAVIYKNINKNSDNNNLNLNTNVNELFASLFMTIPIHLLACELAKIKENNLEVPTYPEFDEITNSKI